MTADGTDDSIEQTVTSVEALLKATFGDAFLLSQSNATAHRYHALIDKLNNIKLLLQPYEKLAGLCASEVLQTAASVTQPIVIPPKNVPDAPEPKGKAKERRSKSYAFDFMLLDLVTLRANIQRTVGLEQLYQAANYLVPGTQRNSLTAKLNRWRNDAEFLEWSSSDDMSITPGGIKHKLSLLPLAKNDAKLTRVPDAIHHAIGLRPSYT